MDTDDSYRSSPGEATPREVLVAMWRQRRLFLWALPMFLIAAGFFAWLTFHTYKAAVVLSVVTSTPGGGQGGALNAITSQLGGLASLAGISSPDESKRWVSIAVLQSSSLTKAYIEKNDLLPILYARKWDTTRRTWKTTDPESIPTLWKAGQYFRHNVLSVTVDNKTGLVTLTITWKDAHLAAQWANGLVTAANEELRQKAIVESERNIAYLNQEAQKSTIVEARQAMFSIMQSEITKEMLARGSDQFAFQIIDPAVAPERPSSLAPWVWILIGVISALMFSILAAFGRIAWNK